MVKPQGRHGEVAVEPHTSFPERFAERHRIFALSPLGERRALTVEDAWAHKGRMVLKLQGIESISDAEALVGCELQIPLAERAQLQAGEAYVSDLVGCTLWARQGGAGELTEVGPVEDVLFGAGEAPLLVVKPGGRELMVPLAAEYLTAAGIDVSRRRVEMALPEGMLELAAPIVSREELAARAARRKRPRRPPPRGGRRGPR